MPGHKDGTYCTRPLCNPNSSDKRLEVVMYSASRGALTASPGVRMEDSGVSACESVNKHCPFLFVVNRSWASEHPSGPWMELRTPQILAILTSLLLMLPIGLELGGSPASPSHKLV